MAGKIDGSISIVEGFLGDYQRRALSHVIVKDNKTSRRGGVLGLRMCII